MGSGELTKYRLHIDGVMDARDVDDAMQQIAEHFVKLSAGVLPPDLFEHEMTFELKEWTPPKRRSSWRDAWGAFDKRRGRHASWKE